MVLYGFENNCGFGVLFLESLVVESHGSSVQDFLLSVSEDMIVGIHFPLVLSLLLLARCEVTVGLSVHGLGSGVILDLSSYLGVNHVLGILETCGGNTKSNLAILSLVRPVVASGVSLSEGLSLLGGILVLFDVVEFVSKATQVLGLDNVLHVVRHISALAVAVGGREFALIISQSPVFLDFARFINM